MLKTITLENYKCFEKLNNLEVAPLTILCGVNSSGKSSIINSLLLQKQSYEANSISNSMKLNGEYVKCGRFNDIAFKRNNKTITLSAAYTLIKPKRYRKPAKKQSKYDITAGKNFAKMYSKHNVSSFNISTSISLELYNGKKSINDNILDSQKIGIQVVCADGENIQSSVEIKRLKNQSNKYVIILKNIPDGDTGNLIESVELRDSTCYFENFNLINTFSTDILPNNVNVSGVLANVYLIFKMNAMQFKNMHYLTPLRVYPQRNYILEEEADDVGLSGEFTSYIMRKYQTELIDGFMPPVDGVFDAGAQKYKFSDCVQNWMGYLKLGKYSLEDARETVQLNVRDYNISNVGFGISQVLPIIVSGLIKSQNELLLLEQPEIHLHPSAQMCMADFLISMALSGREVIAETHSDHIINRTVRRMMENEDINRKVKIYFVDQDEEGRSRIEDVCVDPVRGVLIENENFFTQFASETEKIVTASFTNKLKGECNGKNTFG